MMESVESSFYVFKNVIDRRLPQPPRTIIEVGARNCSETLAFHECYPDAKIYSFECNPTTLPLCRAAVQGIPQIELIEKAVCLTNDKVTFYPIDKDKTVTTHEDGNPGASSLFKASGKYPHEKYAQLEISVDGIRLDSLVETKKIEEIDILWMDIQGGELMALKSLGRHIDKVKFVHTEVEFLDIYENQPLFPDIRKYLEGEGFYFCGFTYKGDYFANALFLNKKLVTFLDKIKVFFNRFIDRSAADAPSR